MGVDLLFSLAWLSSLALLSLVFVLTAALVISKVARQAWARYAQGREEAYKAMILEAIAGEGAPLNPSSGRRFGDRTIIGEFILRWAADLDGYGLQRLCDIFEKEGYGDVELRRLKSPRWWMRARAARRLGVMRCAKAVPALAAALQDRSLDVRLQAAWSLGRLGRVEALERIIGSLAGDSRLAALRVTDIILGLGPRTVPVLENLLDDPRTRVRRLAVDLLGSLGEKSAAGRLIALLGDGEPELRIAACAALGRIGDAGSAREVARLLDDPDWAVRAKAALVVGKLRLVSAIPQLKRALTDKAWWVRLNAGEALAKLGEPGRGALTDCLSDGDRFARDMAAQWLEELAAGAVR